MARSLAVTSLIAVVPAVLSKGLHGRPTVSALQLLELVLVLAFVVWALRRVLFQRPGYFMYFVIALVAIWQGAELIPVLTHGFVLASGPTFVVRTAAVVCLGAGAGLLALILRLADAPRAARRARTTASSTPSSGGSPVAQTPHIPSESAAGAGIMERTMPPSNTTP
jgi:hypothetical protein